MKAISLMIILLVSLPIKFFGQMKNANIIITIDNRVVIDGLARTQLIIYKYGETKESVGVDYIPGKLSIKEQDFAKIHAEDSLILSFNFYENSHGKQSTINYQIEFKKTWLEYSFLVVRIYNLNKNENKKMFFALQNQQFTYEVDSPDGSITRVKRK